MRAGVVAFALLFFVSASSAAAPLDPQSVERADWQSGRSEATALIVKAEVLLDRARFSPGEIDGRRGENVRKPPPSGRLHVVSVTHHPTYRYDPRYRFKGVHAKRPFTIRPGPNNPVGVVWIGLSRKGYGIRGTPDPDAVSKTPSDGCIRLTNWDALSLASAVKKGVPVDFVEPTAKQADRAPPGESFSEKEK
jgi:hypothetical protein